MPSFNFTNDQRSQLIGFLCREKDYILSIESMARRIRLPSITGSYPVIRADLDLIYRLLEALRTHSPTVDLTESDAETLVDLGRANEYPNHQEFWNSIVRTIEDD